MTRGAVCRGERCKASSPSLCHQFLIPTAALPQPFKLSGTEFRRRLRANEEIPSWFAFESVIAALRSGKPEPAASGEAVTEAKKVQKQGQ